VQSSGPGFVKANDSNGPFGILYPDGKARFLQLEAEHTNRVANGSPALAEPGDAKRAILARAFGISVACFDGEDQKEAYGDAEAAIA
jgi:hypothetical protein